MLSHVETSNKFWHHVFSVLTRLVTLPRLWSGPEMNMIWMEWIWMSRMEGLLQKYRWDVSRCEVLWQCRPFEVALVKEIRNRLGDDFHISYTIPCLSEQFEPWSATNSEIHYFSNKCFQVLHNQEHCPFGGCCQYEGLWLLLGGKNVNLVTQFT